MIRRLGVAGLALVVLGGSLGACSDDKPTPPTSAPAPSSAPAPPSRSADPSTGPSISASTSAAIPTPAAPSTTAIPEPTTTNTLPPPPPPRKPAPSTAGRLSAASLPVPAGWRSIARKGGTEEGYLGNGTWVHARDARYAAQDVITLGCAPVTRDDYADPATALEGTYRSAAGEPGIGLVLEFVSTADAADFYALYQRQVGACTDPDGPVAARVLPSANGLINRRTYPDGEWTEVGRLVDRRLSLVILSDPGHQLSLASAEQLLTALGRTR